PQLEQQREDDRRDASEADDEESGSVRRIREGVAQTATVTAVAQLEEAVEQPALPAARAASAYAGLHRRQFRPRVRRVRTDVTHFDLQRARDGPAGCRLARSALPY